MSHLVRSRGGCEQLELLLLIEDLDHGRLLPDLLRVCRELLHAIIKRFIDSPLGSENDLVLVTAICN